MTCAFSPTICNIDLGALVRNFQRLGSAENLMPVVKSDAYGHGLIPCATALSQAGAQRFAVGTAEEGKTLRQAGLPQEIVLLLGCLNKDDWQTACSYNLTPLAGSLEDLEAAERNAAANGMKLSVVIKCDTGMSRLGFEISELGQLVEKLRNLKNVKPVLLLSHLACADMPEKEKETDEQIETFNVFYEALRPVFPHIKRSLGNSAATIGVPRTHYDICRPGLALYGGNPFHGTSMAKKGENLEWVMRVSSPIIHIRHLAPGQSVSYGQIFTASKPMRIAIVGAGYATGISRNLSNRIELLVNGMRARQIGRICMSMLMLDITHITDAKIGDSAWIIGGQPNAGHSAPNAQEFADLLDTIPYEILCLLGSTNRREYKLP